MRVSRIPALATLAACVVCFPQTEARAAARADRVESARVQLVSAYGETTEGALVSREGLIWTTRNALSACAEAIAARTDVDGGGFVARSFEDELPCPGVEARVPDGAGALVRLGDVRLVFAPELSVADFGGPSARASFPRGGLDVVLLRAWDGDRPARGHRFLALSARGPVDGDAVVAPGQPHRGPLPGSGEQIAAERDALLPFVSARLTALADALRPLAARADAQGAAARRELRRVEHSRVHVDARLALLRDPVRVAETRRMQDDLLLALRGPADAGQEARTDEAARALRALDGAWRRAAALGPLHEALSSLGPRGALWSLAGIGAHGSAEPLPETIHVELETVRLAWGFESMKLALPPRDPFVQTALRGMTPRARAEELVRSTALTDPARVATFVTNARNRGAPPSDPLVALRAQWETRAAAEAEKLRVEAWAPLTAAQGTLARLSGERSGADARAGTVRGATAAGRHLHWSVTTGELFAWDRRSGGAPERSLSPRWRDALTRVDFSVPLLFQVDLPGAAVREGGALVGASGPASELVVGILVGTQEAAAADDVLAPRGDGRAVAIASNGLLHALDRVYDAKHLVDELLSSAADR